jgi:rhamnogalacturonyl hydrolase YesR
MICRFAFLPLLLLASTAAHAQDTATTGSAVLAQTPLAIASRLADWQLRQIDSNTNISRVTDQTRNKRGWEQAVFWVGMTDLADATGDPKWRKAIVDMGRSNEWRPGDRLYHADDHVISQVYLWSARQGAGSAATAPTRGTFNKILAKPSRVGLGFYEGQGQPLPTECLDRWCWCDALFMAPPAFFEMSRMTADERYRKFALKEFWATTDFLYDPVEHLYYRDSRFFDRRGPTGAKLFWSRGNGWVLAGLARSIPLLPRGADRTRMETLFKEMAAKIRKLQKPDGYWAPSLLEAKDSPNESSGTAFYTYALAWGINAGLLDRASYEPAVRKGWQALTRSIRPDGRLGWVQQVSYLPEKVQPDDTQYYGSGAFLMAAAAVNKMDAHASTTKR